MSCLSTRRFYATRRLVGLEFGDLLLKLLLPREEARLICSGDRRTGEKSNTSEGQERKNDHRKGHNQSLRSVSPYKLRRTGLQLI